jgi:DNA-binding transcriptional ArsR family regulator
MKTPGCLRYPGVFVYPFNEVLTLIRECLIFTLKDEYMNLSKHTPINLDDTLIALADPTRRAILQRLSHGNARVTELAEPFAISLNSVSKHIRLLERADLVRREKSGRDHWLTLNAQPMDETLQWMQAQREAWTARLDLLEALLREEDAAAAAAAQPAAKKTSPKKAAPKPAKAGKSSALAKAKTPAKGKRA